MNYDFVLNDIGDINKINEFKLVKIAIFNPETSLGRQSIERLKYFFKIKYSNETDLYDAILVNSFLSKTDKFLKKLRNYKGIKIYMSVDEKTDRWVFEKAKIDFVFGLELVHPRDHLHYKRSGLNQVTCKLLKEKNISILFPFYLMSCKRILGRIIQNIRFCRKYSISMGFPSFAMNGYEIKSISDLSSLFNILNIKRNKFHMFKDIYEKYMQK